VFVPALDPAASNSIRMLPEIKPIHAKFAQPLEGKCMRPDDVNFSLSTSSEILPEKADLITMEVLQSVLFAVRSRGSLLRGEK
jgi:hypothetical protein